MSEITQSEKRLKIVSLEPKVIIVNQNKLDTEITEADDQGAIIASFLVDGAGQAIENISELVDKVYEEFNEACTKKNLTWEAELELGMEFGVKFTAKLKIVPKQ